MQTKPSVLRAIFWSSRPISWINTAFPFAAAYIYLTGQLDAMLVVGALYFLIPYNILMYGVNDMFDYESDMRNPRKGGIEGAVLDQRLHRPIIVAAVVSNVPFVAYLLWRGTAAADVALLVLVFLVVAYSAKGLRFKEKQVLDSLTSSSHFFGPMVYAMVLTGFRTSFWPYIIAFVCWGAASHAFGAVQDIIADREAKLSSIATYFGARRTTRLAIALYAASGITLLTTGTIAVFLSFVALLYVANLWPYRDVSDEDCESTNDAWRRFLALNMIAGFAVTMVLIISKI